MSEVIRDKDGNVIGTSRNLRGIREYVGKHPIKVLAVDRIAAGGGKLCILFEDGASFETNFASFTVLCGWVQNWRNAYGAPLRFNGQDAGVVGYRNPALMRVYAGDIDGLAHDLTEMGIKPD